jgi:predicted DNA-binding WGR domain protein
MSAITLHRIDAARNMRRFYLLDVQPDLFGQWCFIREWGRTGSAGRKSGADILATCQKTKGSLAAPLASSAPCRAADTRF